MTRRVVVTGMAGITALGDSWERFSEGLRSGRNAVQYMEEWDRYDGLLTRLGSPVRDFKLPPHYTRKKIRSMGRIAQMATRATEMALLDAGLLDDPLLGSGRMGVAYGSSAGSPPAIAEFGNMLINNRVDGLNASSYIKMMAHTTPVNVGIFFGLKGRVLTTSSACTSGSQGIGYAYEAIRYGLQTAMVAGGAEELCATEAAVFDTMFATSTKNSNPELSPRPFDKDRDGLVIGEGAGTLVLEELDHALARGATIHAEIVGFGTNADGMHVTKPEPETMAAAMELALQQAGLPGDAIGYVSAHGTATEHGDIAESQASARVYGNRIAISSLKSFLGHTLGACGAIEAWASINMMNEGWYHPTINLENLDSRCAELEYITANDCHLDNEYVASNNFAFGGINTSLIFRRWS